MPQWLLLGAIASLCVFQSSPTTILVVADNAPVSKAKIYIHTKQRPVEYIPDGKPLFTDSAGQVVVDLKKWQDRKTLVVNVFSGDRRAITEITLERDGTWPRDVKIDLPEAVRQPASSNRLFGQ